MRTINLRRRLEALERESPSGQIVLTTRDGRTLTLRGDRASDLLAGSIRGPRTPETELVAQSISSTEPGGGHMIDLARAILNSPI